MFFEKGEQVSKNNFLYSSWYAKEYVYTLIMFRP